MVELRRILVPIDFSPAARDALDFGRSLAERYDAQLEILHVVEMPSLIGPEVVVVGPEKSQTLADFARARAEQELENFLSVQFGPGEPQPKRHIVFGEAAQGILAFQEEHAYDLIVMGTHGRTGLAHLFLGSVAERVVRRATCPVLTVRSRRTPVFTGGQSAG